MTAMPAAVDGLLSALGASTALTRVRIDDGPWIDRPSELDIIVIGWQPDEGNAIEWRAEPASPAAGDDSEEFTIRGMVSVWRGDTNTKALRDRADEILEAIRTEVHTDPTLAGAVSRARLVTLNAAPYPTDQGWEFLIEFAIQCKVF